MIPTIGFMIGAYILARMVLAILGPMQYPINGRGIVAIIVAVITSLVTIGCLSDLVSAGSRASGLLR